jgi:hypothetical protein
MESVSENREMEGGWQSESVPEAGDILASL